MTTIVYRDGVLAADSSSTRGAILMPGDTKKVFALPDGRLAAFAGSVSAGNAFIRALTDGGSLPDLEDFVTAIVVENGKVTVYEGASWFEHAAPFGAWGSGIAAALGALHVGATAEQAVGAAIKVDAGSGGKVQSARLKKKRSGPCG